MKLLQIAAAALIGLSLVACSNSRHGYPEQPALDKEVAIINKLIAAYFDDSEILKNYHSVNPADRRGKTQEEYRNEVIDGRMVVHNRFFTEFQVDLYREGMNVGIGSDWVLLGINGAASIFTSAASPLAAAATGIIGARSSYEKRALYEKTVVALTTQMSANRKTVEVRIRTGMGQSVEKYPMSAALSDLTDYYLAGSIPSAVGTLTAASQDQEAKANSELKVLTLAPVTKELAVRKNNAAEYVYYSLTDAKAVAIASKLGIGDSSARNGIRAQIAAAATDAAMNVIAAAIKAETGKDF